MLKAMVEQQYPFSLLDNLAKGFVGRTITCMGGAKIDEADGVPYLPRRNLVGRHRAVAQSDGRMQKFTVNRMQTSPAEPIFRIVRIGFAAMVDRMPIAGLRAGQSLNDFMPASAEIEAQPQSGLAGGRQNQRCKGFFQRRHRRAMIQPIGCRVLQQIGDM